VFETIFSAFSASKLFLMLDHTICWENTLNRCWTSRACVWP